MFGIERYVLDFSKRCSLRLVLSTLPHYTPKSTSYQNEKSFLSLAESYFRIQRAPKSGPVWRRSKTLAVVPELTRLGRSSTYAGSHMNWEPLDCNWLETETVLEQCTSKRPCLYKGNNYPRSHRRAPLCGAVSHVPDAGGLEGRVQPRPITGFSHWTHLTAEHAEDAELGRARRPLRAGVGRADPASQARILPSAPLRARLRLTAETLRRRVKVGRAVHCAPGLVMQPRPCRVELCVPRSYERGYGERPSWSKKP